VHDFCLTCACGISFIFISDEIHFIYKGVGCGHIKKSNQVNTTMTTIERNGKVIDQTPRKANAFLYQIVDGEDLFMHGIYDDLDKAKDAALKLQSDRKLGCVQINRIPLNRIGCYSEAMDCVWTAGDGDEEPADEV
jgi:hypothetical protein